MSDQDVIDLYRCLLGRAPENADTIKAFQHYYPDFARGRQAVFRSEEFELFLADVTGRKPPQPDIGGNLALALLQRAGSAIAPNESDKPQNGLLREGLSIILDRLAEPVLAVVVGEPTIRLDDLAPVSESGAVLQIAPGFPPAVPLVSRLATGAPLFRMALDADGVRSFLAERSLSIGALFLTGRPSEASWVDALRERFAQHAVIVSGPDAPGFDAAALSRTITERHGGEPALAWSGLHLNWHGGWHMPVRYTAPSGRIALPSKAGKPTLAIAAIVRDEAAAIENMLNSVLPIASHVVVMDTGSSDNTEQLARDALRKSGVPHSVESRPHELFESSFADMRNAALDMVPPSIDWVLMLDADEELVPEDFARLFALMAQPGCDAYALPRYNYTGADKSGEVTPYPDRQIRLLRNTPDRRVRYSGAVHETVRGIPTGNPPLDASALGGDRGGPHIHHLVRRFRNAEQEERKQQFYRDIAAKHRT